MVCLSKKIPSDFLKAVFHKLYLVHPWILCLKWPSIYIGWNIWHTKWNYKSSTMHQQLADRGLLNGYSVDVMDDVFHLLQNTYNLQNFNTFAADVARNNYFPNYVVYRGNQLEKTLPFDFKKLCSLEFFKNTLKNGVALNVHGILAQGFQLASDAFNSPHWCLFHGTLLPF